LGYVPAAGCRRRAGSISLIRTAQRAQGFRSCKDTVGGAGKDQCRRKILRELSVDFGEHWNIAQRRKRHTKTTLKALELPTTQCVPRRTPRCDHGRIDMSTTGLDVFDKTLQTT